MHSAVKILHFHLACIKNTHISTSLPTSHTSHTLLRISDRPLITSRTSGKKKSGERYSCNFLLVVSFSLDDGSWQNWDRGARAKRPNTSESKLCCTVSLFSDSVPRLFKIHARNAVWFGFQDSACLKGLKEKREWRGGRREMLTACDGCSSSTVLNKVGTFISQVSCECQWITQAVCFLYFSFVSLITACYLNASHSDR